MFKRNEIMFIKRIYSTWLIFSVIILSGCSTTSLHYSVHESLSELTQQERLLHTEAPDKLSPSSTIDDFIAIARKHNPSLQAALKHWKASFEQIVQDSALPDPKLSMGYALDSVETRVGPQRWKLTLSQTIPWSGKRHFRAVMAYHNALLEGERYQEIKGKLIFDIKKNYADYYYLKQQLDLLHEHRRILQNSHVIIQEKYRNNRAPYHDLVTNQIEIETLRNRIHSIEARRQGLSSRLATLLNHFSVDPIPFPKILPPVASLPNKKDILSQLERNNPRLRALTHEEIRQSYALKLAKRNRYPDLTVGISYLNTENRSDMDPIDNGKDAVMANFALNLPVGKKYSAAIRQRQDHLDAINNIRKQTYNELLFQLEQTLSELKNIKQSLQRYQDHLIPKSKENLAVLQVAYQASTVDYLKLIDSQKVLLRNLLLYEQYLVQQAIHHAKLELLTRKTTREIQGGHHD